MRHDESEDPDSKRHKYKGTYTVQTTSKGSSVGVVADMRQTMSENEVEYLHKQEKSVEWLRGLEDPRQEKEIECKTKNTRAWKVGDAQFGGRRYFSFSA